MLPDPHETGDSKSPGRPFHESIVEMLDAVTKGQRNVTTIVRTLCKLIVSTRIPRGESAVALSFDKMLVRLGSTKARRFTTHDRYWIAQVHKKLDADYANETRRLARMQEAGLPTQGL